MDARVSRVKAARYHQTSTPTRHRDVSGDVQRVAPGRARTTPAWTMPWVGSHRRLLAKTTMKMIPSQKGGVEYPTIETAPIT